MVGYLKPDFKNAPKDYKKVYKSFYCGLCKALKKQYNYIGILSLNYEITSFLLLLSGLRGEKQERFHGSCSISPFVPVTYIDYFKDDLVCAAHLSVLIAYYEIKDNLKDMGGYRWNLIEKYAAKKSKVSINALFSEYTKIYKAVSDFYNIENDETAEFNDIVESNGELIKSFLSALIKNHDSKTTDLLLELSSLLGKWIYLIDACDDLQDDKIKNNYNPLLLLDNPREIVAIITQIEMKISKIIMQLPIQNYSDLINYIFIENLKRTSKRIYKKYIE